MVNKIQTDFGVKSWS